MSVNRNLPHVLVLPEDDANRKLAIGFLLQIEWTRQRRMQVLHPAGGWTKVLDQFLSVHVAEMRNCHNRFMVLLIDLDNRDDRLGTTKAQVPDDLTERVFLLSTLSTPEALKAANRLSYETIGLKLAEDCREGTNTTWAHELLRHNLSELDRLREHVRSILFP